MKNKINNIRTNLTLDILSVINKSGWRFIIQKNSFNTSSIYKNVSEHLSVILENNEKFNVYFKKKFPKSFKYLPRIKFVALLLLFIILQIDSQTYVTFHFSILEGKSSIYTPPNFYSKYSFYFCWVLTAYEFVLSVYVTLKTNSPVKIVVFQIGKFAVKAVGVSSMIAVGYSGVPMFEPNVVTNFVHTKTPFGRGYDYEAGGLDLKMKGYIVSGALGREDMISAAQKYAPGSNIMDEAKLNSIINDPEFKFKINVKTTFIEKGVLGITLVDTSSLSINPKGSANVFRFK